MVEQEGRLISVVGATGLQGRAVTAWLLKQGWRVRALTRDPEKDPARALAELGAEVVKADSEDRAMLERGFTGAHGVYNVQNLHISGYEGEIRQGRNVADAAAHAGVSHLVYGSAGPTGGRTGVPSWDAKVEVTEHVRRIGVPLTVLRPTAFMELMTNRKFYPPVSVWHLMPKLMGPSTPVGWLSVEDLAVIAEKAFADPDRFVGRDLALASDVRSIEECRDAWRDVRGRPPRRFPMPVWLFKRFTGTNELTMWRWLKENRVEFETQPTRDIHPDALTVRSWLASRPVSA